MASNAASPATCELCSELFTDPRMLPCLHSFCKKCLQKLLEEHGTDENLKCPTCEKAACIPSIGVNGFPQDLRRRYEAEIALYEEKVESSSDQSCDRCIKSGNSPAVCFCCSCSEFLCKVCKGDHQTCRKTLNHELVDIIETSATKKEGNFPANIARKPMFCARHNDENLSETCQTPICRDCIVLEHSGHKYDRIEKTADKEKGDLRQVLGEAEAAKTSIDDALAQVEKMMRCVQARKKSVNESIATKFKGLYSTLHSREAALLAKSEEVSIGKVTALTIQEEELTKVRDMIANTYQIILAAAQSYLPAEMLSIKSTMKERLQDLLKLFHECHLNPTENEMIYSYLQVSPLSDAIAAIGIVTGGCCPSTTTAALYIPRAVVGKERKVMITARDENGKPFTHGGERIEGVFSLMGSTDSAMETQVANKGDGIYTLSFTAQAPGEHELKVTINSNPIKGSPFVISARKERAYTSLFQSGYQQNFASSNHPWDVAIDDNGDVFIANYAYHCISVFTQSGGSKQTIGTAGSYGSGDGQFYNPSAIAIRGDVMYIAEDRNNRIQKLSTKGEFISKFGERGSGDGQLTNPRGICLDPNGMIFVGDYSNNRVCVFNADGTFAYNITGNAGEGSNLTNPWGVAFDPSGNLHIANYSSSCIKVFTADGQYVTQYGSGQVSYAAGITVDEEGYTFVTSYNSNYIFVFDPQHKLLTSYQGFYYPVGITFDKEGFIYIADSNNNRVQKY